jgi:hypothetical protein
MKRRFNAMGSSKSGLASVMRNLDRMISRNLKICLTLLPELLQLRRRLQYPSDVSAADRDSWQLLHSEELTSELTNMLKRYKLPAYLLPFLEWLFYAIKRGVAPLEVYAKYPSATLSPQVYNLLAMPAFQFNSPFRGGWVSAAGYHVAILTVEENGLWQVWGNQIWSYTRDVSTVDSENLSPATLRQILRASGDFVVRGNLDLFDADSWRSIGKFLAQMKKERGMGKPLGLVAGRQKGAVVRLKRVLRGMSWREVQILVAEEPRHYRRLQNEYANLHVKQYREEFKKSHGDKEPPLVEARRVRKNAIINFCRYVKKPAMPQLK